MSTSVAGRNVYFRVIVLLKSPCDVLFYTSGQEIWHEDELILFFLFLYSRLSLSCFETLLFEFDNDTFYYSFFEGLFNILFYLHLPAVGLPMAPRLVPPTTEEVDGLSLVVADEDEPGTVGGAIGGGAI